MTGLVAAGGGDEAVGGGSAGVAGSGEVAGSSKAGTCGGCEAGEARAWERKLLVEGTSPFGDRDRERLGTTVEVSMSGRGGWRWSGAGWCTNAALGTAPGPVPVSSGIQGTSGEVLGVWRVLLKALNTEEAGAAAGRLYAKMASAGIPKSLNLILPSTLNYNCPLT